LGKVLLIKFVACLVAFYIGLDLFFNATIGDIVSFSVTTTIISYIIGDRILLPRIGNRNALMADFILAYGIVWLFGSVLLNSYLQIAWGSAITAVILTATEVFVHRYLLSNLPAMRKRERRERNMSPNLQYATEFAEEPDIEVENHKK
jgi:biotin transporter BioY